MTPEEAVEYYSYNIAGTCGADMPLFMDVKVLQGDDIALRGEIAAIRTGTMQPRLWPGPTPSWS